MFYRIVFSRLLNNLTLREFHHSMKNLRRILVIQYMALLLLAANTHAINFPEPNPPTETKKGDDASFQREKLQGVGKENVSQIEWVYHKTEDNQHPNGMEQQQLWLVNRARMNPAAEGEWLATESHGDVAEGREYFKVDIVKLKQEFAAISPMPPAAFDRRLYEAAKAHSEDLIGRDAQDHKQQFDRVDAAGFSWMSLGGVVFSYSKTGLHAHAGFNIDWGSEPDGMQTGRGHRVALMSDGEEYFNVGIASLAESDEATDVGPFVTTGNYAKANESSDDHYNAFIVGTVWQDRNSNGYYDEGEGYGGVRVEPDSGTYFAITSDSGGYAIPITQKGVAAISFSGGSLPNSGNLGVELGSKSLLVDFVINKNNPGDVGNSDTRDVSANPGGLPWLMLLLTE